VVLQCPLNHRFRRTLRLLEHNIKPAACESYL
jgi:hypothetical protein